MVKKIKALVVSWYQWTVRLLEQWLSTLFSQEHEKRHRWFSRVWLIAAYLGMMFLWGRFLWWGTVGLDYEDWGQITVPRVNIIHEALERGILPLNVGDPSTLHNMTDRFLSIQDVITTPEMVMLLWVPVNQYIVIQFLIYVTIGTLGLLWIKRHYHLSLIAYSIMYVLFMFNGYIQAHIGEGHFTWGAYFLFPWFIASVVLLLEGKANWRWLAATSFMFLYMLLMGGEHMYVWLLIFLGFLALVSVDRIKWILGAMAASMFLGAIRLLPPALIYFDLRSSFPFLSGYPSLYYLGVSMVSLVNQNMAAWNFSTELGPWEYDVYVGLIGVAFLLYFGVWQWYKQHRSFPELTRLALPSLALVILSIGNVFQYFERLPIPLLTSERVSTRLIAVPLSVMIVISAICFQKWLDEHPLSNVAKIGALLLSGTLFYELKYHATIWNTQTLYYGASYHWNFDRVYLGNHSDPPYITILIVGLSLTVLTAIFLLVMARRERNKARRAQ
ncbi:MAG TPA: hypothetical protein VMC62_07975 [Longilinea sp.]|nr:hypothetical protein [Longilinea sp.]